MKVTFELTAQIEGYASDIEVFTSLLPNDDLLVSEGIDTPCSLKMIYQVL